MGKSLRRLGLDSTSRATKDGHANLLGMMGLDGNRIVSQALRQPVTVRTFFLGQQACDSLGLANWGTCGRQQTIVEASGSSSLVKVN